MLPHTLSESTLAKIRALIEANFAGRDELYAAMETLDDDMKKNMCQRLAEHLADHAAELEQILLANAENAEGHYDLNDIEFIDQLSERTFLEMVKDLHGEQRVVAAIEQCERKLKELYDRLLASTPEPEAEGVMQRHRKDVEFGEQVLHTMQNSSATKSAESESQSE